jgi:hypothetical protein
MSPLILAIIFSIVVVGGTYFFAIRMSKKTVKGMNIQLAALAERLGLKLEEVNNPKLSAFYKAELKGRIRDRNFYFTHYTRSEDKSASYVSEFSWEYNSPLKQKIWMGKENLFSNFKKQWGFQDILTADKDFDAVFLIKAEDEHYAKQLLTKEIRKEMLNWQRQWHGSFRLDGEKLYYEEMGVLLEKRDTDRIFRLIELGEKICKETESIA